MKELDDVFLVELERRSVSVALLSFVKGRADLLLLDAIRADARAGALVREPFATEIVDALSTP